MEEKLQVTIFTPQIGPQVMKFYYGGFIDGRMQMRIVHEVVIPSEWEEITEEEFAMFGCVFVLLAESFMRECGAE